MDHVEGGPAPTLADAAACSRRFRLTGSDDPRPVLVVLQQEVSTAGRVGQVLGAAGIALDIRRPVLGDALPDTLDDHRGAVVFGGPPSANDDEAYLKREIDWMAVPLAEERPLLGICLGAQMLVKQLGGTVAPHEHGLVEVGHYPLEPTMAGRRFMPDWPPVVYQWHREGFSLVEGATLLAEGRDFPHQAFRYGSQAFGVQFHAELTLAMLHRWTVRGHARLSLPNAQARREHFSGRAVHDAAVRRWLPPFLARIFGREETAAG